MPAKIGCVKETTVAIETACLHNMLSHSHLSRSVQLRVVIAEILIGVGNS